jgi:hypothetical protein
MAAMTEDKDDLIRQLVQRLRETVDENDRLKAELARMTEGATAQQTLQSLHRNTDLPPAVRVKAASACLPHEVPRLESIPPPLELTAEPPIPLAELVTLRRARHDAIVREARDIEVLRDGTVRVLPKPGSNGSDDTGS